MLTRCRNVPTSQWDSYKPTYSNYYVEKFHPSVVHRHVIVSCLPPLTGIRSDLLKMLNHIRRFENHSAHLNFPALAFQQLLGVSEWMRIAEVECKSVVTPVQRPLSLWRWKMVNISVMVILPPRWMTAIHEADHLEMRINEREVRMSLQYAVGLS